MFWGFAATGESSFYNSNPNIGHLDKYGMEKNGLTFMFRLWTSNLVRFESEDSEHYLQFWKENIERYPPAEERGC
jgi:hypothetical protein